MSKLDRNLYSGTLSADTTFQTRLKRWKRKKGEMWKKKVQEKLKENGKLHFKKAGVKGQNVIEKGRKKKEKGK